MVCPIFACRLPTEMSDRAHENRILARLDGSGRTLADVLGSALVNQGVQLRRRLRAKGIDVEAELARARAGSKRAVPKFTGLPKPQPARVYDHGPGASDR